MSDVGTQLMKERESRALTRADVSRETGIFIHHLAALEHGNFGDLPDDLTVAGFVKAYAEYLGFVPEEPVAEFCSERGIEVPDLESLPVPSPTPVEEAPAAEEPVEAEEEAPPAAEEAPSVEEAPPPEQPPAPEPPAAEPSADRRPLWPWLAAGAVVVLVLLWLGFRGGEEPPPVDEEPPATPVVETTPEEPSVEEPRPEETVEAEPEATEPAPPPALRAPPLTVSEHGVGTGVENHQLVGESDRFRPGTRVWFWTRVRGGSPGEKIHHVWIFEGRDQFGITLPLGSANWRTQSAKTLYEGSVGEWAVEARDSDGTVLARSEFTCGR